MMSKKEDSRVIKNRIVVIDSGVKIYPEFPSEIITGCGIVMMS